MAPMWASSFGTSCSAVLMCVAGELDQEGRGFDAGNEPTSTPASDDTGRYECGHDDASTVVNVDAAITEVLGENSSLASRSNRNWSWSTVTSIWTLMDEDVDVPDVGISASCIWDSGLRRLWSSEVGRPFWSVC